jgi:hypothetical protein
MVVGHFAAAMLAKRADASISLGTAAFAAMLADFAAFVLLIAGVEHFSGGAFIPYSHGFTTLAIGGAIFAAICFSKTKAARAAWIVFALVMSHWALDAISHPPDMRIAPGITTAVGLGLWQSLPATLVVEGGLWIAAIVVYLRSTRAKSRGGIYGFWIFAALLTYIWVVNIRRGTDPDAVRAGFGGFLVFGVFVMWMYWMNRARAVRR